MTDQVVCLVRGGEAGRSTQEQAILYAQQSQKQLVFLHVIIPSAYQLENEDMLEPLLQEQSWLARVNLSQARQRAERRGARAEIAIRLGPFVETLLAYVEENLVSRIYVGKPRPEKEDYSERLDRIRAFADHLAEITGVEVMVA